MSTARKFFPSTIIMLLSFVVWFGAASPLQAQEEVGVKVQPTLIEERANPGEEIKGVITVTNVGESPQTYFLLVRDVEDVDRKGRPTFKEEDDTGATLRSWVALARTTLTLLPGESAQVPYTIAVPNDAPPGGHFGGIFLDRKADEVEGSGAGVGFMVGTLMNIQVNGAILEDVQIREFSGDRALYIAPAVRFTTTVKNSGTVLARPRGAIVITDMLGNQVATLTVNNNAGGVLPKKERVFQNEWEGKGFYFGRYDAVVSLAYGQSGKRTVSRQTSFWIIPLRELAIGFTILAGALFLLYGWTRLYVRRQLQKAGVPAPRAVPHQKTFGQRLILVLTVVLSVLVLILLGILLFFA